MTKNSDQTRTWTFLPSVWLLKELSLYQSSPLEARTSPELHRSLRLLPPNSPFCLFLNRSQTYMVVSRRSQPPFAPILPSPVTGIAPNRSLVILSQSSHVLSGWLPKASCTDTPPPTATDLLFVTEDETCVFRDYSMYSFVLGFFHSARQFGGLSVLLRLSGVNSIFIAK